MFEGESTKLITIGCRASAPILVYMKLKALGIYRFSLHAPRSQVNVGVSRSFPCMFSASFYADCRLSMHLMFAS